MKEIAANELSKYLNKPILMQDDVPPFKHRVIIKKISGGIISGFNKSRNSIFEILDYGSVKFSQIK